MILYAAKLVLKAFLWICQQVIKLAGKLADGYWEMIK
jgi:hypothetical protein